MTFLIKMVFHVCISHEITFAIELTHSIQVIAGKNGTLNVSESCLFSIYMNKINEKGKQLTKATIQSTCAHLMEVEKNRVAENWFFISISVSKSAYIGNIPAFMLRVVFVCVCKKLFIVLYYRTVCSGEQWLGNKNLWQKVDKSSTEKGAR